MINICKYRDPGRQITILGIPPLVTDSTSYNPGDYPGDYPPPTHLITAIYSPGRDFNSQYQYRPYMHAHLIMSLGLQVTLASHAPGIETQAIALPIAVSVHNTAESPVTILRWNSPLDPQAGVLGVFEVSDVTDQRTLPIPKIMVSRKLPASEEDLVEIKANEKLEFVVNLPIPEFEEGHQYSVRAQGTWHAVWPTELSNVTPSQLQDHGDAKRGEFLSNTLSFNFD
ncbi:uncharacterized protein MYU51_011283 [Penicillium brevicompactum]